MKRVLSLTAFILVLGLVIAPVGQAQEKRDFFKLGVVTSLSGELAFGGSVTKRGYDMWADTLNAMGGIEIGGKVDAGSYSSPWACIIVVINALLAMAKRGS